MNLHREFLVWEKQLQEQGKAPGIGGCVDYQFALILLGLLCQRLTRQRPTSDLAVVAGEPGFANLFFELAIGIDRRQNKRAPGSGIELRNHQEWIKNAHTKMIYIKKAVRERTASAEPKHPVNRL